MNFKIENNFINITNYPSIEDHFEKMAREGWLITKIIMGSIFIYKKINPEELDFSIMPYEIETAFTRKSKEDLEEFQSVCERVGWNYATKTYNLHIYFKEAGSQAEKISTDEETEFSNLEFIGKRQLKSLYIQTPFLLLFSWFILGGLFGNIYTMKDAVSQIVVPIIPFAIILSLSTIVHIRKFLKINKENIKLGKEIEFSKSSFYIEKTSFFLFFIIIFLLVIYFIYSIFFLRNKFTLLYSSLILIGLIVGSLYRIFVKPSKISRNYKIIGFFLTLGLASILAIGVGRFGITNLLYGVEDPDIDGYKVISSNDFRDQVMEKTGDLMEKRSILIPKSYEYTSFDKRDRYVRTEYGDALNENLAKKLFDNYLRQAKNSLGGHLQKVEESFEEGVYDEELSEIGITKEEFQDLKEKDVKEAVDESEKIMKEKWIKKDTNNLWRLEEVYFLNYKNDEIVIKNGKEVFYLEGKDFTNPEIIEITKDKLEL